MQYGHRPYIYTHTHTYVGDYSLQLYSLMAVGRNGEW